MGTAFADDQHSCGARLPEDLELGISVGVQRVPFALELGMLVEFLRFMTQDKGDFPLQIDSGKIVVAVFRSVNAVAEENDWSGRDCRGIAREVRIEIMIDLV